MVKPILYGFEASPAVRTVLLTAYAIGLELETKEMQIDIHNKTEEYLRKNPQHTIPTLQDGDKCIWDSHAIITYLVSKYGKDDSFYPRDLYARAIIDQRLHFESGIQTSKIRAYVMALKSGNAEMQETNKAGLLELYSFLEKFLLNNTHMAGNSVTVADFSILPSLATIDLLYPVDCEKFPKICEWMKRMRQLPYYEKTEGKGLTAVQEYIKERMCQTQTES